MRTLDTESDRKRKQYERRRSEGRCVRCVELAVPGRSRCVAHLAQATEQNAALRDRRAAAGLCTACEAPSPGKRVCDACARYRRDEKRRRMDAVLGRSP